MRPVSGSSASQAARLSSNVPRPSTRQRVCEGWPSGSTFIHQPRVGVEPPQRQVDQALVLGRAVLDDGPIGLGDLSLLEALSEALEGLAVAAEHEAAGGVAVEPVGERGIARQAEAQGAEVILEVLAGLVLEVARPACTGMPAGLSMTSMSPSR